MIRKLAGAALSATLAFSATACSGAKGEPEPLPPATDSPSVTDPTPDETTEPPEPTDTLPTEGPLAGYTAEEIDAYEEALARYEEFLATSARLRAIGKATPAAKRAYEALYSPGAVQEDWSILQQLEDRNLYARGRPQLSRVLPLRILISDSAGTVTIQACSDTNTVRFFRRGVGLIRQPTQPIKRLRIQLDQEAGQPWTVTSDDVVGKC